MIRRQRSCYTIADSVYNEGRENYLEELDASSNSCNFSPSNPFSNILWNWTSYNVSNNDFSQGRRNRILNLDEFRAYSGLNGYNALNGSSAAINNYLGLSNAYGHFNSGTNQPNYDSFYNGMGDPSDYFAQGLLGDQQRQNLSNVHHSSDRNDSENGLGSDYDISRVNGFPPFLIVEPHLSVSPFGTVFLLLPNLIRIDISPVTRNVYVTNYIGSCVSVLCPGNDKSYILHPNGRILQEGDTIHIQTIGKCAKICSRGIVFSASDNALRYLVDASGTKSTSEKFNDLSRDMSYQLFFGSNYKMADDWLSSSCYNLISESRFKSYSDGNKMWIIGGIRIKQDKWGEASVAVNGGQVVLKTSSTINFVSIITPFYSMSVSCHPLQHLHVKRNNKSVTIGKMFLSVQSGSQRAGFDRNNRLVLH